MKNYFLTRTRKVVFTFLVLIFLGFLQGCMFYYKVQTVNKVTPQEIKKYDSLNKYLILHQGDSAWHLYKPGITNNMLSGELFVLPDYRLKFQTTDPKGGNRYKNTRGNDESCVLDEVHLYVYDSLVTKLHSGENIQIAFSAIKKAEVYKKAKGRTTVSWLVPAIVIPLMTVGLVAGIVAWFASVSVL